MRLAGHRGTSEPLRFGQLPVGIYLVDEARQERGAGSGGDLSGVVAGVHRVCADAAAE